jgi:hypothetical protein
MKNKIAFIFIILYSCSNCYEYTIDLDFKGIVIEKKEDMNNHAYPSFIIGESSKKTSFGGVPFYDLYDTIEVGDSIIKKHGSLDFKIIRRDSIINYHPICYKN